MPKTDAELIAEFLASKGAKKLAPDDNSGITRKDFYKAARGELDLRNRDLDEEQLAERQMEVATQARHVGLSRSEALDLARSLSPKRRLRENEQDFSTSFRRSN
jgi:hypothetical protein